MSLHNIVPCNFKISKNYKRTFVFEAGEFKQIIAVRDGELKFWSSGMFHGQKSGLKFDWIKGTIEAIRFECEQLNKNKRRKKK